ncbi:hypothetical protein N7486_008650 [Penicillium sp. IBT 16267x]|nr:hypothetical protein N7486_008650 [Penicillium sp. IBT 16267x]
MPIQWDREADAKLINALATTGIPDFEAVAKSMGEGVTVSAIKHRLVRIRDAAGIPSARQTKKKDKSTTSAKQKSSDDRHSSKSTSTSTNSKSRSLKNPGSTVPVHAGKGMKASTDASSASSMSSVARPWGGKTVLKSINPEDEDYEDICKNEGDDPLF